LVSILTLVIMMSVVLGGLHNALVVAVRLMGMFAIAELLSRGLGN